MHYHDGKEICVKHMNAFFAEESNGFTARQALKDGNLFKILPMPLIVYKHFNI